MRMVVGIIGAMETEVALLKDGLAGRRREACAGLEFFTGELAGARAVVVRSGVGKVNAALCAQALVDRFGVTHVVNTGAAGALDARLDVGDVVVSTDCVQHDVDATFFGYAPGQVPQMDVLAFPADTALRRAVLRAAEAAAPDVRCFEGRVASGDTFVCDPAEKERIARGFGALCCEMEGAAVAQACRANGVPFVVVRAISDKADGSDAPAYPVFEDRAAHRSARMVSHALEALAADEGRAARG